LSVPEVDENVLALWLGEAAEDDDGRHMGSARMVKTIKILSS
jgi:hypothetical protein